MRSFEYHNAGTPTFWSIELQGRTLVMRSGTIRPDIKVTKEFVSEARARRERTRLIFEKLAAGYVEVTPDSAPVWGVSPADATGAALEAALFADPDDLGAHRAYADYLSEQAEPSLRDRGEFISLGLVLEEPAFTPAPGWGRPTCTSSAPTRNWPAPARPTRTPSGKPWAPAPSRCITAADGSATSTWAGATTTSRMTWAAARWLASSAS
jgi:uncharacterized protein (TIGR02996 family)